MKKRKILVLYQDWGNWFGQDYARFEYWFKKLDSAYDKNNEYFVLSLSTHSGNVQKEKNVHIERFKTTPALQFIALIALRRRIREILDEYEPDYIYAPFIYMLSAIPSKHKAKVYGFLRDKTSEMVKAKGGLRRIAGSIFAILDKHAFTKTDVLFHNGASLAKYARVSGYKGKLIYAPRPIADKEHYASARPLKKAGPTILSIARLTPEKGLSLGLRAFARLPEDHHYLIIGEGSEKATLQQLAIKLGIADRVTFVGFVAHTNIWKYYKTADIFWLLSKTDFEGTPNVLQETLYAGVPPIVSGISAMHNIIDDRVGIIVAELTPKKVAQATENLLSNKQKYRSMQKLGKLKVKTIIGQRKKIKDYFK